MRRLPIYFLLDVSESMLGENLYRLEEGMQRIIGELRTDPHALETAWVSVIAFAGKTREVVPLTELPSVHLPQLPVGGGQGVLVEGFATGGAFAVVFGAVVGGGAGFIVAVGVDHAAGATREDREQGQ